MKIIKNSFFLVSILLYTTIFTGPFNKLSIINSAEKLCERLFGSQIASSEIQQKLEEAREAFNLKSVSPAKHITNKWLQNKFDSFTWFGTWVNKDSWLKMSLEEKIFLIYHEIAHEAKKHPFKQIGIVASALLINTYITIAKKPSPILCIGSIALFIGIIMPYIVREFEKEADIAAAQKLCDQDKKQILQGHINSLEKKIDNQEKKNFSNIWFKSIPEQITYLKAILNQNSMAYAKNHDPV